MGIPCDTTKTWLITNQPTTIRPHILASARWGKLTVLFERVEFTRPDNDSSHEGTATLKTLLRHRLPSLAIPSGLWAAVKLGLRLRHSLVIVTY
jgi:hypothetical protein